MALFLVQHGMSLPEEIDPERRLSEAGVADTRRIAEVAKGYGVTVSRIRHSGKKRAAQTAEIFAEYLAPANGVERCDGMNPTDEVATFAERLGISPGTSPGTSKDEMLVGHLPFMERLAALLVTGDPERPVFQFQNGGIVCIDRYRDTRNPVIRWALMPKIG